MERMQPADTLRFALDDRIDDAKVGPSRVPMALLRQFQNDVADFLAGSNKEVDPNQTMVAIEEGSLAFVVGGLLAATSLWNDVARLQNSASLGLIDPWRAEVVERWQAAARKHPHRRYTLADRNGATAVRVDRESDFRNQSTAVWVAVEKYLRGQVTDLGGTNKPNVHLKLDSGKVLTIASSQKLLADEERNRLYKPATLRIAAEENLETGELRNLVLRSFENPQGAWDEAQFEELVRRGTEAWADVSDDWLESLRSGRG
ncbi:MAG TPA: hypothetical protein VK325_12560 [Pseudoxanthomonas sp.]|nr:hypothetical protein [Pseudoxanthomonas sp.]